MAIGGTIYGIIEAPWGQMFKEYRRHNVRVLEHLPRQDEWPPLNACMFGITGPSVRDGAYDCDLIHFGANFKGLDDVDAIEWIAKFESLLRRIYWFRARMHIEWIFSNRTFKWAADPDLIQQMVFQRSTKPIDRWTFDDGGNPLVRWTPPLQSP